MTYEAESRRALNKAMNTTHPGHGVKAALVGIAYAVLHLATTQQQKGADE